MGQPIYTVRGSMRRKPAENRNVLRALLIPLSDFVQGGPCVSRCCDVARGVVEMRSGSYISSKESNTVKTTKRQRNRTKFKTNKRQSGCSLFACNVQHSSASLELSSDFPSRRVGQTFVYARICRVQAESLGATVRAKREREASSDVKRRAIGCIGLRRGCQSVITSREGADPEMESLRKVGVRTGEAVGVRGWWRMLHVVWGVVIRTRSNMLSG